jgi:hypothetical protein
VKGTNVKDISEFYQGWLEDISDVNDLLDKNFGPGTFRIDEVAVMLPSQLDALQWVSEAVKNDGVTLFNKAEDDVRTYPFDTQYDVNYYFLSTPHDFRVEAMALGNGISPLHEAMRPGRRYRDKVMYPVPVHYSFKTESEDQYRHVMNWLDAAHFHHAQSCQSTYGRFSYWLAEGEDGQIPDMYLKPRVNLRDIKKPRNPNELATGAYLSRKAGV